MIMQTVFFELSDVLNVEEAIKYLKESIEETYSKKGAAVVEANYKAVDKTVSEIHEIKYNKNEWLNSPIIPNKLSDTLPQFVKDVVIPMSKEQGNSIPVSKFLPGGILPPGITKYEKRGLSVKVPNWNPNRCTQCNQCALICPHTAIRPFLLNKEESSKLPNIISKPGRGKNKEMKYTIQISPFDCTGCGLCDKVCPNKCLTLIPNHVGTDPKVKAMAEDWEKVNSLSTAYKPNLMETTSIKGSQHQVLFYYN